MILGYCGEAYRIRIQEAERTMILRDVRTVENAMQYELCTESVEPEVALERTNVSHKQQETPEVVGTEYLAPN